MPRDKNFSCQICGKKVYKKELTPVSILFSGIDKDGTRWNRRVSSKIGVCSGPCSKIWRDREKERLKKEGKL